MRSDDKPRPHRPCAIAWAVHTMAHPSPDTPELLRRIAWQVIRTNRDAAHALIARQRTEA